MLKEFRERAKEMANTRESLNNQYKGMSTMFQKYEDTNLKEYWDDVHTRFVYGSTNATEMNESLERSISSTRNPFIGLYFWVKSEMMDLDAMEHWINERNRLIELRQKIITKQKTCEGRLDNLASGKTTLRTIFNSKTTKENKADTLKVLIENDSKEIVNYQKVINIINQYIAKRHYLISKRIKWLITTTCLTFCPTKR